MILDTRKRHLTDKNLHNQVFCMLTQRISVFMHSSHSENFLFILHGNGYCKMYIFYYLCPQSFNLIIIFMKTIDPPLCSHCQSFANVSLVLTKFLLEKNCHGRYVEVQPTCIISIAIGRFWYKLAKIRQTLHI